MFDLNRRPILWAIGHRFKSNMHIPVCHTNGRSLKYDRRGHESPSGYGAIRYYKPRRNIGPSMTHTAAICLVMPEHKGRTC